MAFHAHEAQILFLTCLELWYRDTWLAGHRFLTDRVFLLLLVIRWQHGQYQMILSRGSGAPMLGELLCLLNWSPHYPRFICNCGNRMSKLNVQWEMCSLEIQAGDSLKSKQLNPRRSPWHSTGAQCSHRFITPTVFEQKPKWAEKENISPCCFVSETKVSFEIFHFHFLSSF